jgi:hypothetical protein
LFIIRFARVVDGDKGAGDSLGRHPYIGRFVPEVRIVAGELSGGDVTPTGTLLAFINFPSNCRGPRYWPTKPG